jgi:glycogen(starch) synthase
MSSDLPAFLELSYDYGPRPLYGMGTHVTAVAHALASLGCDVTVTTRNNADLDVDTYDAPRLRVLRCDADFDREVLREGRQHHSIGLLAGQLAFCRAMYERLLRADLRVDVVHNHSYATTPLAIELAELWGVPLISTVHVQDSMLERAQRRSRPRSTDRHVVRLLEAEGLKPSEAIVAPTAAVADAIRADYPECAERVHILPHPRPDSAPEKRDYRPHQPFRLLYVGRLIPYKGVRELFEAVRLLSDEAIELWVVGWGVQKDELRAFADRHRLPVRWLGHRPHEEVLQLYTEVDALLVPSAAESYGLVLQEGLQAGLPVVATEIEPFTGRVDDGHNGLLVPVRSSADGTRVDVSALTDAVRRLLHDHGLRRTLGENARLRAQESSLGEEYAKLLCALV